MENIVIESSGFANVLCAKLFATESDAQAYAESVGGRVVDRDGLVEKFESMHAADGIFHDRDSRGQFAERPSDEEAQDEGFADADEWMEALLQSQYEEDADEWLRKAAIQEVECI